MAPLRNFDLPPFEFPPQTRSFAADLLFLDLFLTTFSPDFLTGGTGEEREKDNKRNHAVLEHPSFLRKVLEIRTTR